jgi:hypothetical protein
MKRRIGNIVLGAALMLSTLAVPGHSAAMLSLTGNATGGTVTTNGSNEVTSLSDVPYNILFATNTGTTYSDLSGSLNLIDSGSVLELDGAIPSLGINTSIELIDITLSGPLLNEGGSSPLNVDIPSTTSVTESATLLNALGITTPVVSDLFGGGLIGQGSNGLYDVTSDTMLIEVSPAPAPEPGGLLLLGAGLLGIAWFARKRLFQFQQA